MLREKELVILAFMGSIGMTLVILACATPNVGGVWWPFFVVLFYVLSPLPVLIANRYKEHYDSSNTSTPKDLALFITAGIVISAYGLPIVLSRTDVIHASACWLTLMGNTVVFATVFGFFYTFNYENSSGFYY